MKFLTFLAVQFRPSLPLPSTNIYKKPSARQEGDTNVTYYFTGRQTWYNADNRQQQTSLSSH